MFQLILFYFQRMMVWFKNCDVRAVFQCFLCLASIVLCRMVLRKMSFSKPSRRSGDEVSEKHNQFLTGIKKRETNIGCSTREVLMYDFIEMVGVSSHLNVNIHKKWKQSRFFLLAPTGALVFAPLPLFHITSSRSSKSLYNLLRPLKNFEYLCLHIYLPSQLEMLIDMLI